MMMVPEINDILAAGQKAGPPKIFPFLVSQKNLGRNKTKKVC